MSTEYQNEQGWAVHLLPTSANTHLGFVCFFTRTSQSSKF
jgi:hypothetical protein